MKYAAITDIFHLDLIGDKSYLLALAHLCRHEKYVDFYKNRPKDSYLILDNSLIELGSAVSLDFIYKTADTVSANEIVLPDSFLNTEETISLVEKSLPYIDKRYKVQAVSQGDTFEDWQRCWDHFSAISEIDCISIPKNTYLLGGRNKCMDYALANNKNNKEIHLLGLWRSNDEILSYTEEQKLRIRGIDTVFSFHCTIDSLKLSEVVDRPSSKIDLEKNNKIEIDLYRFNENIFRGTVA